METKTAISLEILFDPATHTYTRNGNNYISVTTLLKKYNLSAHYSNQISTAVMHTAAVRGDTVHKGLENYIKTGAIDPNIPEVITFDKYITNRGIDLTTARSEEVIYHDPYLIAGTIDFQYQDGNDKIIADFKTTSSIHWESVAWQLSIYNYIKTNGDVLQYYMNKLMVYHMRGTKLNVREVPLIDYAEVEKLLQANLTNAPYSYTPDFSKVISDSEGVVLHQLISEIENCTAILEDLKKKKEAFQKKLITSMTANNVPTFTTNNNLKITYTPESHRENISKEKLKAYCDSNLIDISQFITVSNVKESVKITLLNNKGGNTNA